MNIMTPWRRSTPLGRGVFLAAAIVATLYGGAKPTNQTTRAARRMAPSAMRMTPSAMRMAQVPQPESTGIPPISVSPWPYESFVKPSTAETFGGVTYYVQYESTSTSLGDISFSLNFQSDDNSIGETTITETTTAAEVVELSVSSTPAGEGSLDIPGGTSNIYGPTEISASTPHLMIPFSAVSANGVAIDDFTISASLEILPAGLEESAYWSLSDTTPLNTVLMTHENNLAEIVNPKVGGIYGLSAEIGGVTTSATIVLPLAGAEISADIEGLFAYADGFVSSVSNSYAFISSETSLEGLLHEVFIGFYWFGSARNGYFTGRPDAFSPRQQTVRWYNQVNDDNGRGAIATLYGCPIYLEKMSNLFAAYACEKLGVDAWKQEMSQDYGTPNDYAAIASWQTGVSLAHLGTGQLETKLRALALGSWRNTEANEPKLRNLWPNPANAVNFCGKNENDNFDTEYYAPGFLYLGGNDHE